MKHIFKYLLFALLFFSFASPALAQSAPETSYVKAKVISEKIDSREQTGRKMQEITARLLDGEQKNEEVTFVQTLTKESPQNRVSEGEALILTQTTADGKQTYNIYDRYRLTPLYFIIAAFFALVIIAAGRRGVGAIVGLGISLGVLLLYIVPQILAGANPLFVSISGSIVIVFATIYLAHGLSQRTTVALAGTLISLLITGLLAVGMVNILGLKGLGSEDAYMLQFSNSSINLQGLLLGGIIIGVLGVLDDVTTTQSATIFALARANDKWRVKHLIKEGLFIGREHITSLVNTLVLAYAGASLPIFIFFVINPLNQPWWLILNSEMITEEIVRTLAGSVGLILAVPITTLLAAFFAKYNIKIS